MDRCIEYWKVNISEMSDPVARKRAVCCEPSCSIPLCTGSWCYENVTNVVRENPFGVDYCTEEWMEVYTQHVELREKQCGITKHSLVQFGRVRYAKQPDADVSLVDVV